jgi:hypothetical protein
MERNGKPAAAGGFWMGQSGGLAASVLFAVLMTAAIGFLTPALARFEDPAAGAITYDSALPAGERAAHYEWKLNAPTVWTRLAAWVPYALNQLTVWGLIAWAAKRKRNAAPAAAKYTDRLDPAGVGFFLATVGFGLLHLAQTQLSYDGLAQDVPVFSSQASVIVMLVLALIMQNDRRGLLFGWKAPMPKAAVAFVRRYHGYYVAWALVYTFWFHPATGTFGHLAGFFYMFLLLSQGALMYTKLHVSLKWSAVLEGLVLVHGTTVALVGQRSPLWTMFFAGFGFMFVASQLWGLRLSKAANWAVVALYAAVVLFLYSGALSGFGPLFAQDWSKLFQVTWIPITLYALVPVFLLLAWGLAALAGQTEKGRNRAPAASA